MKYLASFLLACGKLTGALCNGGSLRKTVITEVTVEPEVIPAFELGNSFVITVTVHGPETEISASCQVLKNDRIVQESKGRMNKFGDRKYYIPFTITRLVRGDVVFNLGFSADTDKEEIRFQKFTGDPRVYPLPPTAGEENSVPPPEATDSTESQSTESTEVEEEQDYSLRATPDRIIGGLSGKGFTHPAAPDRKITPEAFPVASAYSRSSGAFPVPKPLSKTPDTLVPTSDDGSVTKATEPGNVKRSLWPAPNFGKKPAAAGSNGNAGGPMLNTATDTNGESNVINGFFGDESDEPADEAQNRVEKSSIDQLDYYDQDEDLIATPKPRGFGIVAILVAIALLISVSGAMVVYFQTEDAYTPGELIRMAQSRVEAVTALALAGQPGEKSHQTENEPSLAGTMAGDSVDNLARIKVDPGQAVPTGKTATAGSSPLDETARADFGSGDDEREIAAAQEPAPPEPASAEVEEKPAPPVCERSTSKPMDYYKGSVVYILECDNGTKKACRTKTKLEGGFASYDDCEPYYR